MGVRGEIFSNRVILPNRTYFFNVKENRMGDLYLNIVESKNRDNGGFERQSVILFADDLQEFLKGFDESLKALEKAVRDKRHSKPQRGNEDESGNARNSPFGRNAENSDSARRNNSEFGKRNRHGQRREDGDNRRKKDRSERPTYSGNKNVKRQKPQREFERKPDFRNNKPGENKRIVVKKKW